MGAALRLTDKAVLRGGWGVFYVPIGINYWTGVPYGTSPATAAESFRGSNRWAASNARPWFNWDNGYPDNITVPQKDPNFLSWGVVSVDPDSLFQGYNHQYNVSFEYQVSPNLLASAAYMGNVGRRLHSGALKRNQPQRAAYEDPAVDPTAWVSDAGSAAAAGVRYPYAGFSNFAGAALQPFPQIYGETWGPLITVAANLGASRYDSLQLQLTKRMSNGLAGKASYVFSKSRGNVETNFDEIWDVNAGIQDVYDLAREAKTVLSFDRAHVLKGYLQYQLPFGRGRGFLRDAPGWLNAVVGGWDFTWVFRYNTGAPLGIGTNVWYPGWEGAVYADVNGNADLSRKFDTHRFNPGLQNDSVNLFFDRNAFSNPTGHKLGNGARRYEQLRGFGRSNEDIGLLKYWRFKERANLQFRAELLNVFNRHHFADPNTELGNQTNFGYVTGMSGRPEDGPRNVQFGIRLGW